MQLNSKVDDFETISILLHHVIFSYEKAHERLVGTTSGALLQELVKELTTTFELGYIADISKSNSLQENLQSYIDNLNSSEYFDEVTGDYKDGAYVFEIKRCEFAKKETHIILSGKKHTCPFAILAAAVIFYSTGKDLRIHKTDFSEIGSKTVIENIEIT